jgi:hypothetical protein
MGKGYCGGFWGINVVGVGRMGLGVEEEFWGIIISLHWSTITEE